jgi:hypothetical protein
MNIAALAAVACWAVFNGLGKHIWELDPGQLVIQIKVCDTLLPSLFHGMELIDLI